MKSAMGRKIWLSSVGSALAIAASILGLPSSAGAIDFDFSGTFEQDNDVLLFDFSTDEETTVTIFSSSWVAGGFDPILALWSRSGTLLQSQDDGENIGSTVSNGVSYSHGLWDTYFTQTLSAGDYTVSITQFDNFPVGNALSDGFDFDGASNETFTARFGCSQGSFCGDDSQLFLTGDPNLNRTPEWEFHILNVAQADVVEPPESVPEPLVGLGLLVVTGGMMLRRRS